MHMYYAFGNHIYTFSSVQLTYSLFGRHISFSLFLPIHFNIISVSIHNTNAYKVLSESQIFLFGSHICSFISMITYTFLDWMTLPGITFCMYAFIYVCAHTYLHLSIQFYLYPSIHTYTYTSLPTSSHPYIQIHVCMSTYMHIYMYRLLHVSLHTYLDTYRHILTCTCLAS